LNSIILEFHYFKRNLVLSFLFDGQQSFNPLCGLVKGNLQWLGVLYLSGKKKYRDLIFLTDLDVQSAHGALQFNFLLSLEVQSTKSNLFLK